VIRSDGKATASIREMDHKNFDTLPDGENTIYPTLSQHCDEKLASHLNW